MQMFYSLNPFYIIVSVICVLALLDIFYICFKQSMSTYKVKKQLFIEASKNNTSIQIIKTNEDGANLKVKINQIVYLIKIIQVKKNCDVQINCFDTFLMYFPYYHGTQKFKTIPNLNRFMKSNAKNRIIILANQAKNIKKVINECEMIMVTPEVDVYGVHVLNFNQCCDLFAKK